MNLYWISWYQPTEDCRPLKCPPMPAVLGWWCSGYRSVDDTYILCAYVRAESPEDAKRVLQIDWPEADEIRFCEPRARTDISERFKPKSWMLKRMAEDDAKYYYKVTL